MAIGFAALGATGAQAATLVVNLTLDITQAKSIPGPGFQGWQDEPAFDADADVNLAEGDSLDYTIDFLGSQTLTITNATNIWALLYADISSDVTATGTFSLLDSTGTAFLTSNALTSTEGAVHIGQYFAASDFTGGLPASLTFSGIRYQGLVEDYVADGVETRHYTTAGFFFSGGTPAVVPLPEPATWAMMLMGFAGVGSAVRMARRSRMLA